MKSAILLAFLASCDPPALGEQARGDTEPAESTDCPAPRIWYVDVDGDGLAGGDEIAYGCQRLEGWFPTADDCDDADPTQPSWWYVDADRDGFGRAESRRFGCDEGHAWVMASVDCDDADSTMFPGAPELCADGRLNDCNAAEPGLCRYAGPVTMSTAGVVLLGAIENGGAGLGVAALGDIDGDGLDDAVIGAPRSDGRDAATGTAYLVTAMPNGSLESNAATRIEGLRFHEKVGWAVGRAGDLTADGTPDALVSGWGEMLVVDGTLRGAHSTDTAASAHLLIGHSGVGLGDVDGDGFDDVVFEDFTPANDGRACIVSGPIAGDVTCDDARTILTSEGYTYTASGKGVFDVGDIDADGRADLLVAGPADGPSGTATGSVWLLTEYPTGAHDLEDVATARLYGSEQAELLGYTADGAGDVDGDGYGDLIVGSFPHDAEFHGVEQEIAARVVHGPLAGIASIADVAAAIIRDRDLAGGDAVAGAGDLDRDGFDDVLLSRPSARHPDTGYLTGAVNLFYGPIEGDLSLSAMQPTWNDADAVFWGDAGDYAGYAIDGDADFDGDGASDFLVGAEYHGGSGEGEVRDGGAVYVLFGQAL